jgi:hypothetical protein
MFNGDSFPHKFEVLKTVKLTSAPAGQFTEGEYEEL